MDGLADAAVEGRPCGLALRDEGDELRLRAGTDAAGQIQIQEHADDVFAARRLLLVDDPGRVEGPAAAPAPRADRSAWAVAAGLATGRDRSERRPRRRCPCCLDEQRLFAPERPHRQGLGEVVALQHRRRVQPGLAARPALDVGRREQQLAHRIDRPNQHLLRQRPIVLRPSHRSRDTPPAPRPARTPPGS